MLPMSRDCHNCSFNFNQSFLFVEALNARTCVIILLVLTPSKFNLYLIEIPVPYTLVVVGGVPHRVFLLQVTIFICSLEVLGRGYKCKRAIQTPTVWLGGVQVP